MDELKSCPFCGGKLIEKNIAIQYDESGLNRVRDFFSAVCSECGCRTAKFYNWNSAIIAWNRRANDV